MKRTSELLRVKRNVALKPKTMNLRPDKYSEKMHSAGNTHGNALSQAPETHSEIGTKNKPPSQPVPKQLRRNVLRGQ